VVLIFQSSPESRNLIRPDMVYFNDSPGKRPHGETIRQKLSQLESGKRKESKNTRNDPQANDDLGFGNALVL
jgi:hypothetical protein